MLLTGPDLSQAVSQVLKGSRALCAVAFWGSGYEDLLWTETGRDVRVVCNLAMGGTNPLVIGRMLAKGIRTRQCDTLHAKVYIGDTTAVVTSANASRNGLGLGTPAPGWIEAGSLIPAEAAVGWFESIWEESRRILVPEDIDAALIRFIREAKVSHSRIALGTTASDELNLTNVSPTLVSSSHEFASLFNGMSVRRAIILVLSIHQSPMTSTQVAEQLRAGGMMTAALRLTDSVQDAFRDGARRGIFGRASRGHWGLIGWPDIMAVEVGEKAAAKRILDGVGAVAGTNTHLSERVRAGLAAARERGVTGGRDHKLSREQKIDVLAALEAGEKKTVLAERFGVRRITIYRLEKAHRLRGLPSTGTTSNAENSE